jgi:dienelactone hydrolase
MNPQNRPPFDRAEVNGFRCIRSTTSPPETAWAPVSLASEDRAKVPPVNDAVFRAYRGMFSYDRTDLQSAVESVQQEDHYRKEKISFAAAYGGERVIAYLFLPKNAKPPYQTIVYCPSLLAFYIRDSSRYTEVPNISFLVLSGRAVICPVFKGTFERGNGTNVIETGASAERDVIVQWRKDLGRSIDYLETRHDIDVGRLAYYGVSLGGFWGPIFTQVEERLKASVLISAGLCPWFPLPEVDAVHYLPRNHVPTLLIAGRDDYIVPVESHQKPLFRLLGTPTQDKRYVLLDCGHNLSPFSDVAKEVVPWLDRYLGPVR